MPLIGVNTFLPKEHTCETPKTIELIRSTEEEKGRQITNVEFHPDSIDLTTDCGESTLLELDVAGCICAIAVEHASNIRIPTL